MGDSLDIRLTISVEGSSYDDYYHVIARPVKPEYRQGEPTSWWAAFDYGEPAYSNLQVSSQGNLREPEQPAYGWEVEYRGRYSIELRDAEAMVKVLRKVDRGLERLKSELGYPETIGAYIARVAKVLGIRTFGFESTDRELWASGEKWHWCDASTIQWQIDERIKVLQERIGVSR
jgi:hypothetical protein